MPQLNPTPWFMIMTMSWIIILTLLSPKVTATTSQNLPGPHDLALHKTTPWNWPWT